MIKGVVENLAVLPDRRKAIVYFGGMLPYHEGPDVCGFYWMWREIFTLTDAHHITINPVDTVGLEVGSQRFAERYLAVAENTGGRAVVNSNDFEPGIRRIFLENSSYYLLAYSPTNAAEDGRFRRVSVKVNRPGVEVHARRSYWA